MVYILIVLGFVLLIKGADLFVDGASNIARTLRVSPLLIGLTIVAFGTSAPEATVSIIAAVEGNAGVAIGNIVGSNIMNISLVIGVAAFLYPIKVQKEMIRKEIPFTLLVSVVLLILVSDIALQGTSTDLITRGDGFIILMFLTIFLYLIFESARRNREITQEEATVVSAPTSWTKNILLTVGGLVGIILGGELVVNNAVDIALSFGMSETLVGLTIVSIGTSLPELITSITAAMKKESDIALGNIIGSNIFNILFVLGTTAVIHPLALESKIIVDILIMIVLTIALLIFSRTNFRIGKYEGLFLVIAYILYTIFIIIRN
ncbi:sodium:calcium antiporter [Paraliobacillus quinghaiensis]|uniref:Sodium:calcium antiporter n=1 Tax=Paraliobacillus quinghaiensis TaxID=470815 RepID=A0A917TX73_9BACI|nr:calcium/sodium antiporter [Paraliobacillus quinghaiensis]GGM42831.1 sodium:calcium antiporter [Paraliobacillus quinghaiensis]